MDRYLDVTKSALLFGGRVLLVEGIAEALLLPIIAKNHVLKGDQDRFRIFRSAVFVPIDGVDFECYLRLLMTPYNDIRIAERVVIITDGDRTDEASGTATPGERRKSAYDDIAKNLGASHIFRAVINTYSLETELVNAGNNALLREAYLKLHPKSEAKWDAAVTLSGDQRAAAVQGLFKDTAKGDFAQLVAESIRSAPSFHRPGILADCDRGARAMKRKPFKPTPEQEVVIAHKENAFITACPGAGKTQVLVERARQELKNNASGQGLAFLSFTNAAISELKARLLSEALLLNPPFPHYVGTFDTFIWQFFIAPLGIPGCVDATATHSRYARARYYTLQRGTGNPAWIL